MQAAALNHRHYLLMMQEDTFEMLRARDAAACGVGARAYHIFHTWQLGGMALPDPRAEGGLREL